jgi:uncharacterized protein (DUF427 family)
MFMNLINLEFSLSAKLKTQNIESRNENGYDSTVNFSRGEVMNLDVKTARIPEKVMVIVDGETIAETSQAVVLLEKGYDPVYYIPKNDIREIDLIKCGDYECPKGHAELYTIRHGAHDIENAAWSYDEPDQHFPELIGRVAFYPDKVQEIRIME